MEEQKDIALITEADQILPEIEPENAAEENLEKQNPQPTADRTDNPDDQKRKSNGYELTLGISGFLVLIGGIAIFLLGIAAPFGDSINVITVFNFATAIFNIRSGIIYECIAKLALAVIFVIYAILMINKIISSCGSLKIILAKDIPIRKKNGVNTLLNNAISVFFLLDFYILFCHVLSDSDYTILSHLAIIGGFTFYFLAKVFCVLWLKVPKMKHDKLNLVFEFIQPAFIATALSVLIYFFIKPFIVEIIFGVQILFGGYWTGILGFFDVAVNHVLIYIVNMLAFIFMIQGIRYILKDVGIFTKSGKSQRYLFCANMKQTMIWMTVAAIMQCIMNLVTTSVNSQLNSEIALNLLWTIFRQVLPAIFIAIAIFVYAKCGMDKATPQSANKGIIQ